MDPILVFAGIAFVALIVVSVVILKRRGNIGLEHGDRGQAGRTAGEVGARTTELWRKGGPHS